ncbi:MAG: tRNA pseudouridine(38-40) synthase TruA [Woeseiaceae bacterium]|nr:tRNA pseudouridine(38-40) synthase TruA [Woeseiaceae bacterium]
MRATMRIAIGIEYDGTAYNGWQRQRTGVGVQQRVEQALGEVANESIEVTCAGRTDAGVHATAQVAHFDTTAERSERGWLLGANSNLPDDINVRWVQPVGDDFHARFSATSRSYEYRILNRLVRSALHRHRAWWVHQPLDDARMHEAAQALVGEHDFSAFRAAGCQASTAVRELTAISVARDGDWLTINVTANAFLQHMVRNITGTLVTVGMGEAPVAWLRQVLDSRDRTQGGMAAPAHGLTLVRVTYPGNLLTIPA